MGWNVRVVLEHHEVIAPLLAEQREFDRTVTWPVGGVGKRGEPEVVSEVRHAGCASVLLQDVER